MAKFQHPCLAIACYLTMAGLAFSARADAIEIRNLQPGAFAIETSSGVSLKTQARIEKLTGQGWESVFDQFWLVEDCGVVARLPACVTLGPGAVLRPVAWNGYSCSGQCERSCKKNVDRLPGTFRLVVTLCNGEELTSAPFSMGTR